MKSKLSQRMLIQMPTNWSWETSMIKNFLKKDKLFQMNLKILSLSSSTGSEVNVMTLKLYTRQSEGETELMKSNRKLQRRKTTIKQVYQNSALAAKPWKPCSRVKQVNRLKSQHWQIIFRPQKKRLRCIQDWSIC